MKLCRAVSRCTVDFAYTAEYSIDRESRSASVAVRTFVFVGAENYINRFADASRKLEEWLSHVNFLYIPSMIVYLLVDTYAL